LLQEIYLNPKTILNVLHFMYGTNIL